MISKNTHSKEWLDSLKNTFKRKDPGLLEKSIKALTLLEGLQESGMDFVFKGGTALLLLIKDLNRLSIDIDIIMETGAEPLAKHLQSVIKRGDFIRFEENIRKGDIPKSHYKFYYEPKSQLGKDAAYVLLDVLFEKVTYPIVKDVEVRSDLISFESPAIKVRCPDANSILGDKLTAFAPNTTGIRYGVKKEIEIIKQLYDIGKLFNHADKLDTVAQSYKSTVANEINYRKKAITPNDVLDDIFDTALTITLKGTKDETKFKELLTGIQNIESYIYNVTFRLDQAVIAAGKAAYLSRLIKHGKSTSVQFSNSVDLSNTMIVNADYTKLNKLKKSSPEAFFYWHKAIELL